MNLCNVWPSWPGIVASRTAPAVLEKLTKCKEVKGRPVAVASLSLGCRPAAHQARPIDPIDLCIVWPWLIGM